ncbi:uncharacterized protein LOC127787709 [Diospyros lotus]|uniref:uncharacterized protein LOC127787709 n=1 Tax=Diospyros lotus TaxID=55363 RepID=UPI00225811CC|nr:uncharacterized protein LOC127787709 [Diospyros lotus]
MASLVICSNSASPTLHLTANSPPRRLLASASIPNSASLHFFCRRKTKGLSVVTRAAPGASTYVFALVLPLSLLAITVFTSIRIADKLDKAFIEEIAMNQAIMGADEEEGGDAAMPLEEKPLVSRTRNRPKREAESSST